MNSGGRANEAGSAHRSAVAAYLAVHGLAGRSLHALGPEAPTVKLLVLESDDAIDDIRCHLSDGTVLMLQAKNQCGVGRELRETLAQWARQPLEEPTAGSDERRVLVGVVAERFKGEITALPEALNRRRQPEPGVLSAPERKALTAVARTLDGAKDAGGTVLQADQRDRLLDVAYAILIDATGSASPWRGEASAWLETLCAESAHGDAAFNVLQRFFQTQASRGSGSTVEEWLTVLADAGHPVAANPQGLIGQRRMAERDALRDYRERLAGDRDTLHLSRLAGPLPPMHVPKLLASFTVTVGAADDGYENDSYALAAVARRWGRLVVTGRPGAGKTCALDQLAAQWAGDPDAPVPVLVRLRDVASTVERGSDLTLDKLVECGVATSPHLDRALLRPQLEKALRQGDAALLLDGLDECGPNAGPVADGITALATTLPPATSIIVTTRHGTSSAAAKTGLPTVDLRTPSTLRITLRQLVQHAAHQRGYAGGSAWVHERQAWVASASASDRGLWSVPLLATLMTLQIIRNGSSASATSRARLIAGAVEQSAERWSERARVQTSSSVAEHEMPPSMAVEGFGIIARKLAEGDVVHRFDVVTALSEHVSGPRWNKAPGAAEALAGAVVSFWDHHVGAFLVGGDEVVEARAVHLVEIGEALWIVRQEPQEQRRWLDSAIDHEDRREAVVLAAGLSDAVLSALVETAAAATGATVRGRGLCWASDAARDYRGSAAVTMYERLIDAFATEATISRTVQPSPGVSGGSARLQAREERDGPGWRWVRHLACLPLPASLRARRDDHLEASSLTDEQRVVADALRLLTDAVVDAHEPLPPATVEACAALLALEVPAVGEQRIERASRRSAHVIPEGPRLLSGHADAAVLMARHPEVLDDGAVTALHRLLPFATLEAWDSIVASLEAASLQTPPSAFEGVKEWARGWADGEPYQWFCEAAAACGTLAPLDRASRWNLAELASVAGILGLSQAGNRLARAREADPVDAILVLGALADAHGIDRHRLAAQARYVGDAGDELRRALLRVVRVPEPPSMTPRRSVIATPAALVEALLDLFDHSNALLANAARALIYASGDPEVGERLLARLPSMRARRRWWAALVGVLLADDAAIATKRLLDSHDGPTRAGAAAAARHAAEEGDVGVVRVVVGVLGDPDYTVRLDGGAPQDEALQAEYWSCPDCASRQSIEDLDCSDCDGGARPGKHP